MFTGIIEEVGSIERTAAGQLVVHAPKVVSTGALGDSVAVNGVCLTIAEKKAASLSFDVMEKTAEVSGLGALKRGDLVNLERAARPDSFLGGHIVQGHVDGTGKIRSIKKESHSTLLVIAAEQTLLSGLIAKGSVAIDGVSLTVAELFADSFSVSLIPTTLQSTTLGKRKVGDTVNIETDVLGKYVKKYVQAMSGGGTVTEDLLRRAGFVG